MFKKELAFIAACLVFVFVLSVFAFQHYSGEIRDSDTSVSVQDDNIIEKMTGFSKHISEVPDGYIGIYTAEDFTKIGLNTEASYILMNDIDLEGIVLGYINNNATIDGNNYNVWNYKGANSLFYEVESLVNFHLKSFMIHNSDDYLSSLAYSANYLYNCSASGNLVALNLNQQGLDIGGLVVYSTKIENCNSYVNISGLEKNDPMNGVSIGGICSTFGRQEYFCDISDSNFYGTIDCTYIGCSNYERGVGGIVGSTAVAYLLNNIEVTISGCNNYGKIVGVGKECTLGGIIGSTEFDSKNIIGPHINNCSNQGVIENGEIVGGIVGAAKSDGANNCIIYNCYNTGEFIKTQCTGAIVGDYSGITVRNCAYLIFDDIGISGNSALFLDCKALTENEMKDIKNYPFENIEQWENTDNYPKLVDYISANTSIS